MRGAYGLLSLAFCIWCLFVTIDAAIKLHIWPF